MHRRAGLRHRPRQCDAFVDVHPLEEDRHRERGRLTVADAPVGEAGDELLDLGIGQTPARRAWRG